MEKIRVIQKKQEGNTAHFISVNDLYKRLSDQDMIEGNYLIPAWNFKEKIIKQWEEGFKDGYLDSFIACDFIHLDFNDIFVPFLRIGLDIRSLLRNEYSELYLILDNEHLVEGKGFITKKQKEFVSKNFELIEIDSLRRK